MDHDAMEQYWIWLSSVDGIGPRRFYQLISIYEDARAVWDNVGDEGMRFLGSAALRSLKAARCEKYFFDLFARIEKGGMHVLTRLNDAYPPRLSAIFDPPPTLYTLGDCPLDSERSFAIVGSRRCTRDGQRAAREIAETLAREVIRLYHARGALMDAMAAEHTGGGVDRVLEQIYKYAKKA